MDPHTEVPPYTRYPKYKGTRLDVGRNTCYTTNMRNWTPHTKRDLMAKRRCEGLCTLCGCPNDRPSHKHCEACAHKKSQYDKQTRAQRIIDRLCTTCGRKRPLHGYKTCTTCRGLWPEEPKC